MPSIQMVDYQKEGSIHISNLLPEDPKTGKPSRVGRRLNDKGKLVRFLKNQERRFNNGLRPKFKSKI